MLIVKGHPARLATQSEQFANELTRHLGICAPDCRILRKVVCAACGSQIRTICFGISFPPMGFGLCWMALLCSVSCLLKCLQTTCAC